MHFAALLARCKTHHCHPSSPDWHFPTVEVSKIRHQDLLKGISKRKAPAHRDNRPFETHGYCSTVLKTLDMAKKRRPIDKYPCWWMTKHIYRILNGCWDGPGVQNYWEHQTHFDKRPFQWIDCTNTNVYNKTTQSSVTLELHKRSRYWKVQQPPWLKNHQWRRTLSTEIVWHCWFYYSLLIIYYPRWINRRFLIEISPDKNNLLDNRLVQKSMDYGRWK